MSCYAKAKEEAEEMCVEGCCPDTGHLKPVNLPQYSYHQTVVEHGLHLYTNKTAREKHRSVSAEEAAAVPDAVSTGSSPDTERFIKAQQPRFYANAMKPVMPPIHPPTSRSKTLAWFLADDLLAEKKNAPANGSMKTDGKTPQAAVPPAGKSEDKKRRRALRRAKKSEAAQLELAEAEANAAALEDLFANDRQRVLSGGDDYWYYDVASDGYYYEQNGAKGWRRRMPNSAMQRIKEQEMAQLASGGKMPILNAAQAHAFLQSALFSQPALKYYDANSDGFFYEMASVDGWKRRQPNKPVHQSLNGLNTATVPTAAAAAPTNDTSRNSYGATLARGQIPRPHCVLDDSSASSSVSEDTSLQDVFGLDTAFSGLTMGCDSPFRPTLNSSSTTTNSTTSTNTVNNNHNTTTTAATVSRPDSLSLCDQILPGFNADKFIQDLSFSGLDPAKVLGSVSRTPADPWASRCGGWTLPPFDKPTTTFTSSLIEEDDNSSMLLKDLEKIWATPVGGLNA
ncbi:unnamed protein product [Cylicocyclus nassatus]|uniref:Uncharacterized protein n=1 Tax=Cylicocyclus nassatus TaxID=53992 RepID=A0AA36DML5_CYLNA|nr:unnamed protein product [Cylicocyclus nassatus]